MQLKLLIITICVSAAHGRSCAEGKHVIAHREKLIDAKDLLYLGEFNNKEFYISHDLSTQEQSRSGCAAEGLTLAKFDIQEELNFVFNNTYATEDYSWTSGSAHFGHSAFKFDDNSEINPVIAINGGHDYPSAFGLVIDRYSPNTDLQVNPSDTLRLYLCYR